MREPKRIQRKRTKGFKMPSGAVYVGRPTKFGNPFPLSDYGDFIDPRESCMDDFREGLKNPDKHEWAQWIIDHVHELRGKDLACWCPIKDENNNPVPCHADVLLALANSAVES